MDLDTGDNLSQCRAMNTASHAAIIARWPSCSVLAAGLGVKAQTIRKWKQRDRIPSEYWHPLVEAARARGIDGVSLERLAAAAAAPEAA